MRTLVLMLFLLVSSVSFAQEFGMSIGLNANSNPSTEHYTATSIGMTSLVSCKWYIQDSIPFRVTLAQENYKSELRFAPTKGCDFSSVWQASEVNNIALIVYPLTYQIKNVVEINWIERTN